MTRSRPRQTKTRTRRSRQTSNRLHAPSPQFRDLPAFPNWSTALNVTSAGPQGRSLDGASDRKRRRHACRRRANPNGRWAQSRACLAERAAAHRRRDRADEPGNSPYCAGVQASGSAGGDCDPECHDHQAGPRRKCVYLDEFRKSRCAGAEAIARLTKIVNSTTLKSAPQEAEFSRTHQPRALVGCASTDGELAIRQTTACSRSAVRRSSVVPRPHRQCRRSSESLGTETGEDPARCRHLGMKIPPLVQVARSATNANPRAVTVAVRTSSRARRKLRWV